MPTSFHAMLQRPIAVSKNAYFRDDICVIFAKMLGSDGCSWSPLNLSI
jgi:hypothetical protein